MTKTRKPRKPREVEDYWQAAISCYLIFMEEHFSDKILLDGVSARNLKNIVRELRLKAERENVLWTRDMLTRMLLIFFRFAWINPDVIKSQQWFTVSSYKHLHEIFEQIHNFKTKKVNHD